MISCNTAPCKKHLPTQLDSSIVKNPGTTLTTLVVRLLVSACLVVLFATGLTGCITTQDRSGQSNNPAVLPEETSGNAQAQQEREAEQARRLEDADRRRQQAATDNAGESAPAVVALRLDAENESASGNLQTANLLLERALRIDPADSLTYLQLAQLRLDSQEYKQAAALARRGLSLNPPAETAAKLEKLVALAEKQADNQA